MAEKPITESDSADVEFLVASCPPSRGDRIAAPHDEGS
jgi:hypothetical protein